MKYRSALLLVELDDDPRAAFGLLRRIAPELEHVSVVARLPAARFALLFGESPGEPDASMQRSLVSLRESAVGVAATTDVQLAPELTANSLEDLAIAARVDLLVAGAASLRNAVLLFEVRKRLALPVLWPAAEAATTSRAIERVWCIALGRRARAAVAGFLHEHGDPSLHVRLLSSAPPASDELATALAVAGIRASVEVPRAGMSSLQSWLDQPAAELDLLVLTRMPMPLLVARSWPAPVLLLPPVAEGALTGQPAVLDVTDALDMRGSIRIRVDYATVVGSSTPAADLSVGFVADGRLVATAITTPVGQAELPAGLGLTACGVVELRDADQFDPLRAIEQGLTIIRPAERALVAFDAELPDAMLRELARWSSASDCEPLAVRLRPTRSARAIRERLRELHLPARVIDARAVLDEGDAFDVSEWHDPVRLARVTAQLFRAGFAVEALFHRDLVEPQPTVFPVTSRGSRAEAIAGNRIELELDNQRARHWLLEAIGGSRSTLHLQVYMAADDEIGRSIEAALTAAADRGVTVRVLVDSLHGWHGSFGSENTLLTRLSALPGVELRTSRPVRGIPSIIELKQRDHRKLVVSDGQLALIGGRNLSHEYYTGFDEVALNQHSQWREVPWLDGGARIAGPAVAAIEAAFMEAWTEAGGDSFAIATPEAVAAVPVRIVVHRGLRDASTLEAYRELIESAMSHIYVVNGFPLVLELQYALWCARKRGVRVTILTGHLAPTHGGEPFQGPWSAPRAAATEFVHSRLDALVEAGSEVYFLTKRGAPSWSPGLGAIYPHVHAKIVSVDGRQCAVGSANLDITSSYWESELMGVIEDTVLARQLETQIDALLVESTRWDRDDPVLQKLASRRTWMRRWPGVLSI